MKPADLTLDAAQDAAVLRPVGALVTSALGAAEKAFAAYAAPGSEVTLDLSRLDRVDTGGALLLLQVQDRLERGGARVTVTGASDEVRHLIDTVRAALPEEPAQEARPHGLANWLQDLGRATAAAGSSAVSLISFLGLTMHRLGRCLIDPRRLRPAALVSQMQEVGLNAVPIVVMMSFLIGVVLSFQGAQQLRQFGAEIFVVDLIAISILRELGILLTAIIVAGRSGSAFTASIGSMKVREEIDAMRTLGLDPVEVLVVPRVLALILMLPALGFIANVSGLFGGMITSWLDLGVSPGMFLTRLKEGTDIWHLGVGMIKAPVFALIIGVVACWRAMLVKGSSESVGQQTTASVVQSIFLVIAVDALFSIFFTEVGV